MGADDENGLARFVRAQDGVMAQVRRELAAGRKTSHWMWFVFPQIAGLGYSSTSRYFAIRDPHEARGYLADPVLGPRLRECVALVNGHRGKSAAGIFGRVDAAKLRSCLTLFARAAGDPSDRALFEEGLSLFFGGSPDEATLGLIREQK